MGDQLHGVLGTLDRTAVMAGNVAGNIEGHRASLQPIVAALQGQWVGQAPIAFTQAHTNWEQSITRLVAALNNLGENTRFSSAQYMTADETGSAAVNQAGGGAPFNGALA
ncbi:MAG: WXG100 family type VII secretion target [Spirillospora sp.]